MKSTNLWKYLSKVLFKFQIFQKNLKKIFKIFKDIKQQKIFFFNYGINNSINRAKNKILNISSKKNILDKNNFQ